MARVTMASGSPLTIDPTFQTWCARVLNRLLDHGAASVMVNRADWLRLYQSALSPESAAALLQSGSAGLVLAAREMLHDMDAMRSRSMSRLTAAVNDGATDATQERHYARLVSALTDARDELVGLCS